MINIERKKKLTKNWTLGELRNRTEPNKPNRTVRES